MENLEVLKLELLSQKTEIENKGGVVSVANNNPSPSEITAGIKTIVMPDLSSANATVEDVVNGKTFYAGDREIKVGTKVVPDLTIADATADDVLSGKTFYAGDNTIKIGSKELPKLEEATATAEDVLAGKTFFSGDDTIKTGVKQVPDLTIADATVDDVLLGKTFYAGDNSIKTGTKQIADLSNATATEEDVITGKTFYAGNQELKVGTAVNNTVLYKKLFISNDSTGDEQFYFNVPAGVKKLKSYLIYNCTTKKVEVTFNGDLEEIEDYAFYGCRSATFPNFSSLLNLKKIGQNSFGYLDQYPIDFSVLPTSLTSIGLRCFNNSMAPNSNIVLHSAIKEIGTYCFANSSKREMNNLLIADDIALKTLPGYMIENLIFNCDFKVPSTVTSLAASFAYGSSFNNIIIPATCTSIGNGAFYAQVSEAASYRRLKTVTFESETPPSFGTYSFAQQDKTNGFKIYVPDNAVDTYKAVAKLSGFVDYIYPVSQKP